jgi:hypothetical protein
MLKRVLYERNLAIGVQTEDAPTNRITNHFSRGEPGTAMRVGARENQARKKAEMEDFKEEIRVMMVLMRASYKKDWADLGKRTAHLEKGLEKQIAGRAETAERISALENQVTALQKDIALLTLAKEVSLKVRL